MDRCARCGGLSGLGQVDPRLKTAAFNCREVCKQLLLLEDHLAHPHKRCDDCIHKHRLLAEALAEEAVTLDGADGVPVAGLAERVRAARGHDDFRRLRKRLTADLRAAGLGGTRTALPGEINGDAFDRFTLAHAASGYALGAAGVGPGWTLALAVLWEVVERPLKDAYPSLFPNATQDTLPNMVVDVIAVATGAYFARGGK